MCISRFSLEVLAQYLLPLYVTHRSKHTYPEPNPPKHNIQTHIHIIPTPYETCKKFVQVQWGVKPQKGLAFFFLQNVFLTYHGKYFLLLRILYQVINAASVTIPSTGTIPLHLHRNCTHSKSPTIRIFLHPMDDGKPSMSGAGTRPAILGNERRGSPAILCSASPLSVSVIPSVIDSNKNPQQPCPWFRASSSLQEPFCIALNVLYQISTTIIC